MDTWTFPEFPGLELRYHRPLTAQEQYETVTGLPDIAQMRRDKSSLLKVEDYTDEPPGNFTITAHVNGVLAGRIHSSPGKQGEYLHFPWMEVKPAFQGKGIAKKLMCAALVKGREAGFTTAIATVEEENIGSRRVLACCGARFGERKLNTDTTEDFYYYEVVFILDIGATEGGPM